jgi:ATP-dependent RNA/DNA helicase IGHMBP2
VGFLADERRLNVAVTRARRHVCIVGDSETVRTSPFIAGLLDHVARVGDYVSAAEYLPADAVVVAAPPVSPPPVMPKPPAAPPVEVPSAPAAVDDGAPTGSIPVTAAPTAPLPPASGELRVAFSGETVAVPFAPAWTVGELKRAVAEATGVEAARQKLVGARKFVDDALPLAAAAPRLANGAKLILMVVPRPEDAVAPQPPPRGKKAKKARRKVKAAAAAEPVAAPAPAPSTASQQLTGANSLLQQLARDRAARAAKAPRPAPAPAPKKNKKPPKKKAPPAGDDSDLDDDALLAAAIQANKKEKKREPAYKRWVDADGNIKGNTLHARQAERDRAALVAKLEKKKAGAAREKKQPAKK